jgi:hypothetical protein
MAEISDTYQEKVGIERGGDRFYMKSDGEFKFYDTDFTGAQLRNINKSALNKTIFINSAGLLSANGGSAPPVLPSDHGLIILSIADAASNASARLGSAKVGEILTIITRGGGSTGSVKILLSGATDGFSGVSVFGLTSGGLSSIDMNNSATSQAYIKLQCFTEGTWEVVDVNYLCVTMNAGA